MRFRQAESHRRNGTGRQARRLCWHQRPALEGRLFRASQVKVVELENECPKTLAGWVLLFEGGGLLEVKTTDVSGAIATMTRDVRKKLGVLGQLKIMLRIIRRWGIWPVGRILATERIFSGKHLGYAIVVGRKAM